MLRSQPYNIERDKRLTTSTFIMLVILVFMVWEWLRPLLTLTSTYTIQPFILYFALALLLLWLNLSTWIRAAIMSFFLLYFLHHLYIYDPFFSKEWLKYLGGDLLHSLRLLLEGDLTSHSFIMETLLFLLVMWFSAIVIYKLVFEKSKALFFFVLTVIFLAIIDTFTPYSAVFPIIRTFIYGFALLTFRQITRMLPHFYAKDPFARKGYPLQWVVTSGLIVVLVTWVGMFSPKFAPSWPDPIAFIEGYSNGIGTGDGVGGGTLQRIGYGTNDERLGGSFIMDDSLVFVAHTAARGYWRGESKDTYTGKGWIQSTDIADKHPLFQQSGGGFNASALELNLLSLDQSKLSTELMMADIVFDSEQQFPLIFYTGEPQEVTVLPRQDAQHVLEINRYTGSLQLTTAEGDPSSVHGYTLETQYPTFSTQALLDSSFADAPAHILETYTQLPDTLPDRVGELAESITALARTDYEKVKRIERYFRFNGYEYNIEQTAFPAADEDYVDQFLFETKLGYCDNFSSAMVVLLRTLDIPARWVKGFTFGDIINAEDGVYTTEVRNKNAHSWVEVYFPEIGWVPFEPTQSFYNPFVFERDDMGSTGGMEDDQQMDLEDPLHNLLEEDAGLIEAMSQGNQDGSNNKADLSWLTEGKLVILLSVVALVFIAFLIFMRRNLVLTWAIMRYREATDEQAFFHLYGWLIRYLGRFVTPKAASQTMREYILDLEEKLDITELKSMTQVFERMRYGKESTPGDAQRAYQIWRNLINKLRS